MADNEDTDDLYADLYGEVSAGDAADKGTKDESDLIGYEEEPAADADKKTEKPASSATTGGSFIPAATATAPAAPSGPARQSFIPGGAGTTSAPASDAREVSAPQSNSQSGYQQAQQGIQSYQGGMSEDRPQRNVAQEMPEEGKMFIGGLNWDTTEDSLRRYFSQFGEVAHVIVMRDNATGRSRGFAFLNYVDPKSVNTVVVREHYLDGKVIDPKRAIPKSQQDLGGIPSGYTGPVGGPGLGPVVRNQKLFIGGLPPNVTSESFRRFFEQYGTLQDCTCMMDRETGKPRGFGFLTFMDDASIEILMSARPVFFDGKEVDIKRAQSRNDPASLQVRRQQQRDPTGLVSGGMGGQHGQYGAGNGWGGAGMMNPMMMGMMGGGQQGGFDPNAMAQMYQNMGWGSQNWNPMAWQQMMAGMAGGAGTGANAGGMDMSAMMGMGGIANMGMMGMGAGSMSPQNNAASATSAPRDSSAGPKDDNDAADYRGGNGAGSRYQRPPPGLPSKPRNDDPRDAHRDYRERSPRQSSGGRGDDRYRRDRSPDRRDDSRRYDNDAGSRNRY